jgi:hypothetical protein
VRTCCRNGNPWRALGPLHQRKVVRGLGLTLSKEEREAVADALSMSCANMAIHGGWTTKWQSRTRPSFTRRLRVIETGKVQERMVRDRRWPKRMPPLHRGMGGGIRQHRTRLGGIGERSGCRVRLVNRDSVETFRRCDILVLYCVEEAAAGTAAAPPSFVVSD